MPRDARRARSSNGRKNVFTEKTTRVRLDTKRNSFRDGTHSDCGSRFVRPLVPSSCSAGSRVSAPRACSRWPSSGLSSAVSRRSGNARSARVRGQNLRGNIDRHRRRFAKRKTTSRARADFAVTPTAASPSTWSHHKSVPYLVLHTRHLRLCPYHPRTDPCPGPHGRRARAHAWRRSPLGATEGGCTVAPKLRSPVASRQRDELVFEGYVWRHVYPVPNLRAATSPHSG